MDITKKYFLVLTALKNSLPKDKNVNLLYIGEWCLPTKKDAEIVPYIFDSAAKMNSAYIECEEVYKRILMQLVPILNKIHHISYDYKSYEIILGNWLKVYIHQLFEKYCNVKYVFDNYDIVAINLLNTEDYYIPLEYIDYMQLIVNNDKYNLQQYSEVIRSLGYEFNSFSEKDEPHQKISYIQNTNKKSQLFENIFKFINKLFRPKVTITAPYFDSNTLKNYLKLFISNIGYFNFDSFSKNIIIKCTINKEIRDIISLDGIDEFEKILCKILPYNIPLLFIEGFADMKKESEYFEKDKTVIYYTSNALHSNYLYKFFLAKNYNNLIITAHQHGGGYGIHKMSYGENYERSVANKFYTWGWNGENASYLPHNKLTYNYSNKKNNKTNIFIPLTGFSRYLHRFQNQYFSSLYLNYQNNILSFLDELAPNLQNNILIRNYPNYYGWNTDRKILNKFPNIKFDDLNSFYNTVLENSRIVISLHLTTTYLESLVRNIPTLIYINKNVYEFNEETQKLIDNLFDNNIVFYNIKSLVLHLDNIYNDVDKWWLSEQVQEAKNTYLYKHARNNNGFVKEWNIEFKQLLENNGK